MSRLEVVKEGLNEDRTGDRNSDATGFSQVAIACRGMKRKDIKNQEANTLLCYCQAS